MGRLIDDNLDWRDEGGRKKGTGGGAGMEKERRIMLRSLHLNDERGRGGGRLILLP